MRIGVITDAHANLPAVQAVLRVLDDSGCELIVHTGDAVGYGPNPQEVVETLMERDQVRFVQGNHDQYAILGPSHRHMAGMEADERAHHAWVREELDEQLVAAMAEWPMTIDIDTGSHGLHFCHYALGADGRDFAPILLDASPDAFDQVFGVDAPAYVFYGHHHPTAWVAGRNVHINPGALGVWKFPVAHFAVVTVGDDGTPDVQLGQVGYDGDAVVREMERKQVPARALIVGTFYGVTR